MLRTNLPASNVAASGVLPRRSFRRALLTGRTFDDDTQEAAMHITTFAGTQTPVCSTIIADEEAALRKLYELLPEFDRPLDIMSPLAPQVPVAPMDITSYI